jgi:glycosyltransferase involved in cell wall biosynthesis
MVPKVSIGMPVYNGEKYLREAIRAILEQTFEDFELIISDNASEDGTRAICEEFAKNDARIRYVRNPTNLGAVANYNHAVRLAQAEYFHWATYDDLIAPTFLEKCVKVLDDQPEIVLCSAQTVNIDENGSTLNYYDDNFAFLAAKPHHRFRDILGRLVDYDCNAEYGLIRRSVLMQTGMEQSFHSADKVLLAELVLHGKFHEIQERLFYHRFHPGITTAQGWSGSDFMQFLDTGHRTRRHYPLLRRFVEFFRAVNRAPITTGQRLRCYACILRFYASSDKWKRLQGKLRLNTPLYGESVESHVST